MIRQPNHTSRPRLLPILVFGMLLLLAALPALAEDPKSQEPAAGEQVAAGVDGFAEDRLVDVGGHRLRARILGPTDGAADGTTDGSVVVFDAGKGDGVERWGEVPGRIAATHRVVLYDRAGYDESEMGPTPRTSEKVAGELRSLLGGLELEPPYVLVGHSMSGMTLRAYTHLFPEEVAGLVFLDVTIEGMFSSLKTPEGRARYEAQHAELEPAVRDEGLAFWDNLQKLPTYRIPDPPIPAVVISGAVEPHIPPEHREQAEAMGLTLERLHELRALKLELATGLAEKFSAPHVLAVKSGHYVHHDEPDLVTAEISKVLEAVRSASAAAE